MLTACGIETLFKFFFCKLIIFKLQQCLPLAVLKLKMAVLQHRLGCNSAYRLRYWKLINIESLQWVATTLQQCLPLAVLKLTIDNILWQQLIKLQLQQCLPLAVLKLHRIDEGFFHLMRRCNSAYRLRYWNIYFRPLEFGSRGCCCNSAYRLRYWNFFGYGFGVSIHLLQQCLPLAVLKHTVRYMSNFEMNVVATVLTACGIETTRVPTRKGKEKYN